MTLALLMMTGCSHQNSKRAPSGLDGDAGPGVRQEATAFERADDRDFVNSLPAYLDFIRKNPNKILSPSEVEAVERAGSVMSNVGTSHFTSLREVRSYFDWQMRAVAANRSAEINRFLKIYEENLAKAQCRKIKTAFTIECEIQWPPGPFRSLKITVLSDPGLKNQRVTRIATSPQPD